MQGRDHAVDLRDEGLDVERRVAIHESGRVHEERGLLERPQVEATMDRPVPLRRRAQEGVELALGHLLQAGILDVEDRDLGVLDLEHDLDAGDRQRALQVQLVRAARADTDGLAVEIARLVELRVLRDEEQLRRRVVRLREVQARRAVGIDRPGAVRDVPTVVPVPADDLAPGRVYETGLHAEPLGDQLARIGVVAAHLVRGHLVGRALCLGESLGALDDIRLWRVGGVGGEDERAACQDLRELVGRRVTCAVRRAQGGRGDATGRQRDEGHEQDGHRQTAEVRRLHALMSFRGRRTLGDSLLQTRDVEMIGPAREVRMEVLQRGAAKHSLGLQAPHDRIDSGDERAGAQPGAPIDGPGQICDVLIAADGLQRKALGDRLATDGNPAEEGIELASGHVREAVALDVVADERRTVDQEPDLLSGQVEVPLDVVLRETARAATEPLARELLNGLDARALADEEALGLGRIGLREVQAGHSLARDAHGSESDVPAIAPVPADLLAPRRGHEARLHPEAFGDELAGIHVVAGHLIARELVRRAFGVSEPHHPFDAVRLWRIGRVGGEDERAAREDLGELVGRRVAAATRRSRGCARCSGRNERRGGYRDGKRVSPFPCGSQAAHLFPFSTVRAHRHE